MACNKTIVITVPKINASSVPKHTLTSVTPSNKFSNMDTFSRIITAHNPSAHLFNTRNFNNSHIRKITHNSRLNNFSEILKEELDIDMDIKPPRKRQRLDHLSLEQKIMRRKMKNRVAAQTARDRKKLQMDALEAKLAVMNKEQRHISDLNKRLEAKNKALCIENENVKAQLSLCTCNKLVTAGTDIAKENHKSLIVSNLENESDSLVVDGVCIVNDSVSDSDFILVQEDAKPVNASDSRQSAVGGVRIPVSIECVESAEDQSTVNRGSTFVDSGVNRSVFAVQQPTVSTFHTQPQTSIKSHNQMHSSITTVSPKLFATSANVQQVHPNKLSQCFTKVQPHVASIQTSCEKAAITQVTSVAPQFSNASKNLNGHINTACSSRTAKGEASNLLTVDDILTFESLIRGYDDSSASEASSQETAATKEQEKSGLHNDEELLKQLNEILEQVTAVNNQHQQQQQAVDMHTSKINRVSISSAIPKASSQDSMTKPSTSVPDTPHILNDILSFDADDIDEAEIKSKLLSSVSEYCASLTMESVMQLQQQQSSTLCNIASSISSDSDYESLHSPSSETSEAPPETFDYSYFDELFPGLV